MKVNRDLILKRIEEIEESIFKLKNYIKVSKEEFIKDKKNVDATKYQVIRAFEASFSICNHICAKVLRKSPSTYSECFELLAENKIISDNLGKKFSNLAKFRNIIIHLYWEVDDNEVYRNVKNGYKDFQAFVEEIKKFIEENG
jgi:uncharacterized protein YutE (UPF0331/DUF86 family)